jgi:hypothetical protein
MLILQGIFCEVEWLAIFCRENFAAMIRRLQKFAAVVYLRL